MKTIYIKRNNNTKTIYWACAENKKVIAKGHFNTKDSQYFIKVVNELKRDFQTNEIKLLKYTT